MKLCIVSSGDFFSDYGGGQVYVRNIVDEFVRRRYACDSEDRDSSNDIYTTVVSFVKDTKPSILGYKGITVYQVCDEVSFRNALIQIHPDIVHANGEKLLSARLCRELGIPCIVTAHHGGLVCPAGTLLNTKDEICHITADYSHCLKCYLRNIPTGLFWHPLLKHFSQRKYVSIGQHLERLPFVPFLTPIGRTGQIVSQKLADWQELCETATHFISPSDAMAAALERNGCPKDKISVIPHGIPDNGSRFKVQGSISDKNPKSSQPSTLDFYYVGRINYVKGIHVLLKAFSGMCNSSIRLHIIGGAVTKKEQRYMRCLQRRYRKDQRIIWHGKLLYEQMQETIINFHCLIHPTICLEAFGLDIAEALQAGKYVIATCCGGAEMQIHNKDEGLLVEPNNIDDLRESIRQYISNARTSNSSVESIRQHTTRLYELYNIIMSNSLNAIEQEHQ